ncbi:photosynthetic reaction center cytochrome c subunit family protein [Paludibaculum fermentans]|uniref:Photosynthetic reaction center cytochrome c subunit n=1 Tax=Paludibaculum fermentans TaxID=1473598 RepID=A0A7S7SN83_PALFE|nr:photosynthetic reaction center cytochrome c subunit family protein [Paludibaculum fermentans]QOY90698.1 photosynthetic reaction center cytochrome c subunit [Paludibaculum fermentans]
MKTQVRLACVAIAVVLGQVQAQTAEPKKAEEVYKNITELKGTPADQLLPAMQFISASLGVQCSFCHVQGKNEADDKKAKLDAREMIAMTNAMNKTHFKGQRELTCNSCHHGATHPASMPPVQTSDEVHAEAPRPSGPTPTAEQILDKYVEALGGEQAIQKVTSRVIKGVILAGGQESPIEITAKAPNKRISAMTMPNGQSLTAFDGTSGWLGNTGRPARVMSAAESDAARMDAEMYMAVKIKSFFESIRPGRPEKIGDVACVALMGMRPGQPPVRMFFDRGTGLLVRTIRYTETPLGRNPTQIDYADYKEVDGVKLPMKWTLARPNGRFTIQIKEVQQNVPVEDSKFAKPAGE